MPKIKTINAYVEAYSYTASLDYSTKAGLFYVKISGIVGNYSTYIDPQALSAVFDSLRNDYDYLTQLRIRDTEPCIVGSTESDCENNLGAFMDTFFKSKCKIEKVILYSLEYNTPHGHNKRFSRDDDKRQLEYLWIVLEKETYTGDPIYYKPAKGGRPRIRLSRRIYDTKEIPWTQDLEDFLNDFDKSFHGLIERMLPFFKDDGKLGELISNQKALLP